MGERDVGRGEERRGSVLEEIDFATGCFDALGLGFGELLDVSIHGVLDDC